MCVCTQGELVLLHVELGPFSGGSPAGGGGLFNYLSRSIGGDDII